MQKYGVDIHGDDLDTILAGLGSYSSAQSLTGLLSVIVFTLAANLVL